MWGRARSRKTLIETIKKDLDLKWSLLRFNFSRAFKSKVLSTCLVCIGV